MIGIDLFSGAGGMSLGARLAGIDVQIAVEADPHAATTYLHNHQPKHGMFGDDIRKFKKVNISRRGQPVVVFGGPPCQGFSTSNQKTRSATNEKNWLFREFFRVVKDYHPDWVVFENVKGLLETERGMFVEIILQEFKKLGYEASFGLLHATDFGIPQNRARLFIIGSLHGSKFEFPQSTTDKPVTVQDAIGDLPILSTGASVCYKDYETDPPSDYAHRMRKGLKGCNNHLVTKNNRLIINRYKHIPQGSNWKSIPEELMENYKDRSRCHTGIYRRLELDRPSVVIGNYRKNMLIHPTQDRGLSVREAARIQSFPDDFTFKGSIGFQQQQVGNAVPPLLAEAVFKGLIEQL
ncbi:DNA-cytosine methyltransferase [Nitrincola lacisaponensis]|uniref:DNA (cytosine-5-)-methyltransferase n=1 Tax=Nitrincola lacisaponensis TaxID=267850 RepID=A0A063Y9L5_9GAMM|nr:DNA cytosine methyltransferase [Nitrincola lacisaponensis]KDE41401.1 DNA-cytosine methyltransferase [Nitrincola lacisaponensis]